MISNPLNGTLSRHFSPSSLTNRVDPYPIIPTQYAGGAGGGSDPITGNLLDNSSPPSKSNPITPPISSNPSSSSSSYQCPGPKSVPIQLSPSHLYKTPSNHPLPLVGSYSQVKMDFDKCLTYRGRYEMYTDESLGIWYRQDVDEEEEKLRKEREELWDNDYDNPKPIVQNQENLNPNLLNGGFDSKDYPNQEKKAPLFNRTDSLFGPKKPKDMDEGNWERHLRDRMWKANVRSEELGPVSFPDWRGLMDNCFEQRERERGADPNWNKGKGALGEDINSNGHSTGNVFGNDGNGRDREGKGTTTPETKRTALVMRSYEGYVWVSFSEIWRLGWVVVMRGRTRRQGGRESRERKVIARSKEIIATGNRVWNIKRTTN